MIFEAFFCNLFSTFAQNFTFMAISNQKIGILGGGQLGKMLCIAAAPLDLDIWILDTEGCPSQPYCRHFVAGDFRNYDAVMAFGKQVDVLTIEIEDVNLKALKDLEKLGKKVYPNPKALGIIKDKGLQKQFYAKHKLPTEAFELVDNQGIVKEKVASGAWQFPFVWKSRTGGYDGKGVQIVRSAADLDKLPDVPCLLEKLSDIDKEIAVIVARNDKGEVVAYPSVEMVFDPKANLLDLQVCPSAISKKIENTAQVLAKKLIKKYNICGLLAVEMFLTKSGELLINEVAPRPHNSGHHTIEAHETSQFEQHLRSILGLPLGATSRRLPSVLLNLVGAEGFSGAMKIEGLAESLHTEGVHFHLYGKAETRPFRKMGHITVLNKNREKALEIALRLKENIRIVS